jgi:TonB family protein
VVRSIPLLDEAALEAVHNWHFQPTLVNGQAVPVRMNVSVSFSTSQ